MRTSSNRNAFLTGLNVLMVPMLGWLLGQQVLWTLWAACGLAALGMAALFWQDAPWNLGDTLTLAGALMFALYVIVLERAMHGRRDSHAPRPLRLTGVQMLVMVIGSVCLLGGQGLWRGEGFTPIWAWLARADAAAWLSLAYLAFIASIVGLSLQVWGQRHVSAVSAAIVYGNEPVFAALAAWVLIREQLSVTGWLGAALIVSALILSQLPERVFQRGRAESL
jgi:drug/metabolite transporter (DMT)-like permease